MNSILVHNNRAAGISSPEKSSSLPNFVCNCQSMLKNSFLDNMSLKQIRQEKNPNENRSEISSEDDSLQNSNENINYSELRRKSKNESIYF